MPAEGPRHRVLVIALAPVVARSRLAEFSDDVDREMEAAEGRLQAALEKLRAAGVKVDGHAGIAHPRESLMDGLREYPLNEVLLLPDRETD